MKDIDLSGNKLASSMSLSFVPIRGKKPEEKQEAKKTVSTIGPEELEKQLKELYKTLEPSTLTTQITSLAQKATPKDFLNVFFRTFHDATIDIVKQRIPIIRILFESKFISDDVFLIRFSFAMTKIGDYDSPNLPQYMAQIYLDYMSIIEKAKLTDINLPDKVPEEYMADLIYDACIELLNKAQDLVKTDYLVLASRLTEKDVELFKDKLKEWKETSFKKE